MSRAADAGDSSGVHAERGLLRAERLRLGRRKRSKASALSQMRLVPAKAVTAWNWLHFCWG